MVHSGNWPSVWVLWTSGVPKNICRAGRAAIPGRAGRGVSPSFGRGLATAGPFRVLAHEEA